MSLNWFLQLDQDSSLFSKLRKTALHFNGFDISLATVRLSSVSTDLLITVNVPYHDEESAAQSMASAECFTGAVKPGDVTTLGKQVTMHFDTLTAEAASEAGHSSITEGDEKSVREEDGGQETSGVSEDGPSAPHAATARGCGEGISAVAALQILLRSFTILDWSLFG